MFRTTLCAALLLASPTLADETETAFVAGGCFWCVEADFESVEGVGDVVSGFMGGTTADPVYRRSGDHIEAVRIPFDPEVISYAEIMDLFLRSIDPLDAGGQFCDRGLEYTTAIFADGPEQAAIAEAAVAEAEAALGQEIVTPVREASTFYPVDDYHQDYYKSTDRLGVTSVGVWITKSMAYGRYRKGCGRDARVKEVWGDAAPFADKYGS